MAMPAAAVRLPSGEGTGPYRLAKWRKNHEMVFVRRDPAAAPDGFDTVRYCVIDDVSTQWLMFLKGEIDFLGEVSRDNWDAVIRPDGRLDPRLAAAGVRLSTVPALDSLYIGVNMRDRVLGTNRPLRQALNAAFDAAAWEKFYAGRIIPSDGPVPPGVEGRLETPFAYAYDLEKARRLMVAAGYPGGRDASTGRRLVLDLAIGRASQDSREAGELLAAFYERIGIKLELSFYTWDAFVRAVKDGRVQLYRMGWVGDYPDAENFLQLFHSRNVSPGPNHSNYRNPAFDRAYDAAMAAPTPAARLAHWHTCQEILREDCPWVFTHYNKANSLVRARVGNYRPSVFPYGQEAYLTVREQAGK
jgi:ABC-type transport system substrate-binding protein